MTDNNILGIFYFGSDPSACLLRNGSLIAFMEEDRFTRVKHAYNQFPVNSIRYCLDIAHITLPEVDFISVGWRAQKYPYAMALHFLDGWYRYGTSKDERTLQWEKNNLYQFQPKVMKRYIIRQLKSFFGNVPVPKIDFVGHHHSHAITAYHYSGFQRASLLTIDGSGEENSTVLWLGDQGSIEELLAINIPNSIGWFYSGFTEYAGFKPYDGEGKLMGLAPYGKTNPRISEVVDRVLSIEREGTYALDPSYIFYGKHTYGERFTNKLVRELRLPPRKPDGPIEQYADIAYHAQAKLEQATQHLVKKLLYETGTKAICLSGGVAYNCKMNGSILDMDDVENIFIFPVCGDNGSSIGAALATYEKYFGHLPSERLEHISYGIEFSNEEIEQFLRSSRINYEYFGDVSGMAGELLARGNIIGWFQGRQEGGPRALGNRSILADPRDARNKDRVNLAIKEREPWRPFAPSMLDSATEEYLENPYESPFMNLLFKVKEAKQREIPAVVHVDGTTRPQTVKKETNLLYWRLIKSFEDETSIPVVLNTSFNKRGEPIVCHPQEAYHDFMTSGLDILVMGNYLIHKKGL